MKSDLKVIFTNQLDTKVFDKYFYQQLLEQMKKLKNS